MIWLAVAAGGGIGSMLRHGFTRLIAARVNTAFPVAIFAVNAVGCLVIGVLAGLLVRSRIELGETGRVFVFVGILGGFTTFSSFGLDTFTLFRTGHSAYGVLNAIGQVVVGLAAVWIGFALGTMGK